MQRLENERILKEKAMDQNFQALENEKDRRKDLLVSEIRASGFGAMQDLNQNKESDFVDNMTKLKQTDAYEQTVNIQQQKANDSRNQHIEKLNLKREELNLKRELKDKDVQIAIENKNQYDMPKVIEKKKK
jgi:hypothetical protein